MYQDQGFKFIWFDRFSFIGMVYFLWGWVNSYFFDWNYGKVFFQLVMKWSILGKGELDKYGYGLVISSYDNIFIYKWFNFCVMKFLLFFILQLMVVFDR